VKSRAIFTEVREGRGVKGGVVMDVSALPREELESYTPRFCRVLARRNLDPLRERIVVAPAAHFFMGAWSLTSGAGRECRGAHVRRDFPAQDSGFPRSITVARDGKGGLKARLGEG
jgi:succinate dehydrogenase/fumarate reductase flavoprotein subunit